MGYIFYMMGKSSSGKDSIFKRIMSKTDLGLKEIVGYTTRPMRAGETEGKEYHFVSEEVYEEMKKKGIVIESRDYDTVHGIWSYFTADDGQVDLKQSSFLVLGTLESYEGMRNYYGKENLIPIYIEVEDGERLMRALKREMEQESPKYAEMCRRFLADTKDFSEENIEKCEITKRYINNDIDEVVSCIIEDINKLK